MEENLDGRLGTEEDGGRAGAGAKGRGRRDDTSPKQLGNTTYLVAKRMQTHPHDALDLQHGVTALHASAMVVEGGGADGDAAECKWRGTARERERKRTRILF